MRESRPGHSEGGFALIGAIAAIAIFGMLSYGYSLWQIRLDTRRAIDAEAQHDVVVQDGVNKFINDNRLALIGAAPVVAGFADPFHPTMTELQTEVAGKRYLPEGFNQASAMGTEFTVALGLLPVGCAPGVSCTDIEGWITSVNPLLSSSTGLADPRLSKVVDYIGTDAASSLEGSGSALTSVDGVWAGIPNPHGNVPGILVIRAGFGSIGYGNLDHLLPRDGSRPMAGTLNMNSNDIINASHVTATSTIQGGEFYTLAKNVGDACSNAGATASGLTAGGIGVALVCSNGTWHIEVERANAGDACTPDGKIATSVVTTEQLVCKNSVYVRMLNLLSKYVEVARYNVQDGDAVPMPICDSGGTPKFAFIVSSSAVDVAVAPPKQSMELDATPSGADWIVSIKLKDNFGGSTSGNSYGIRQQFSAQCMY